MKILQLIGMGASKFGGFEKYILELSHQLSAKGHSVLVAFSRSPENIEYAERLAAVGNVRWIVLPPSSVLKYVRDLCRIIHKYKPDVIHTNFGRDGLLGLFAGRIKGVKTVYTAHGMPLIEGLRGRLSYRLRSVMSDRHLAVSAKIAEELREKYGVNGVEPLYLGVEEFSYDKIESRTKLFPEILEGKVIICSIAFHDPIKGVDILLKALAILKYELKVDDFFLLQVGGGSNSGYREYLHHLGRELGLESDIRWMGIRNDVPEILTASDIYCQSSRSEGISLAIMEASAAGLPTVAFDSGGMPEIARKGVNGLLAKPENESDLAAKLALLIRNTELRGLMGEKAKEVASESFRLSVQVRKLIGIYESLC